MARVAVVVIVAAAAASGCGRFLQKQQQQQQQQQQQPAISAKACSETSRLGLLFSAMPAAESVTIQPDLVLPRKVILRNPKPSSVAEAKRIIHGKNTPPRQRVLCIMHWALGNPKLLVEVAKAVQADKKAKHAKCNNARRKLRRASMTVAEKQLEANKRKFRVTRKKQLQKKWQAKKPK